jgi:hypothetical protein
MREGDAAETGNKPSIARSLHPRSLSFSFSVSSFSYGTGHCFFQKKYCGERFRILATNEKKNPVRIVQRLFSRNFSTWRILFSGNGERRKTHEKYVIFSKFLAIFRNKNN